MGGEIRSYRFEAWKRLSQRYLLEPVVEPGESTTLSKLIVPVTIADELLRSFKHVIAVASVTGVANIYVHTVPANKRWFLHALYAVRDGGTWTMDAFGLYAGGSTVLWFDQRATPVTEFYSVPNQPLPLDVGHQIAVRVPVHSVTGNMSCVALYTEEDVY